jgi:hydrogenase 3 maturation protease
MRNDFPLKPWQIRLFEEIRRSSKTVILGVGNMDRGDDGAGVAAAGRLKAALRGRGRARMRVLIGHETPENLTGEIRAFGPGLVLILDAADGARRPGAVFLVEKEKIADDGVSTHKISPAMLVCYLEESVGCRVLVLGIQPKTTVLRPGRAAFSAPVERAVSEIVGILRAAVLEKKSPRGA